MGQDAVAASPGFARNAEAAPAVVTAKVKRSPRRLLLPLIALGGLAWGAYYGNYYLTEGRYLVSTDDAYVGANTVIVSPKISGYV